MVSSQKKSNLKTPLQINSLDNKKKKLSKNKGDKS